MAHILVVDDEPTIRFVICEVLHDGGFETFSVGSGSEALELLEKEQEVDAIVIDLRLRDMTGKDVLTQVRGNPRWKSTPVVLMTGAVYSEDAFPPQEAYQALFAKPFRLVELRQKLQALLEGGGVKPA